MLTWNFFFVGSFTEKTIRINQIEKLWQRNYYNHKEHNHFREPGFNLNIRQSLRELANARFLPVWSATFLLGLLDAPVNALLPVYVEVELGESPLLSAGLRSTFLLLGGDWGQTRRKGFSVFARAVVLQSGRGGQARLRPRDSRTVLSRCRFLPLQV